MRDKERTCKPDIFLLVGIHFNVSHSKPKTFGKNFRQRNSYFIEKKKKKRT